MDTESEIASYFIDQGGNESDFHSISTSLSKNYSVLQIPLEGGLTSLKHKIYNISTVNQNTCCFFFTKCKISDRNKVLSYTNLDLNE